MTPYARLTLFVVAGVCASECRPGKPPENDTLQPPEVIRVTAFIEHGADGVARRGFRTKDGRVVIPPVYAKAWAFSEDRSAVQDASGHWGFVSTQGVEVIPTQFEAVIDFSEGLAPAKRDGRWGYIDRDGRVVLPFRYASVGSFSEGLAEVQPEGSALSGMIDTSGRFVIPPRFLRIFSFEHGYADAQDPDTTLWGLVNRRGEWVIAPRYDHWCSMNGDKVQCHISELWGHIGRDGAWRVPPGFLNTTRFFDGVATARLRIYYPMDLEPKLNAVFVDSKGRILAGPYEQVLSFWNGEGEVWCAKDRGWGAVDRSGRFLRPCDPEKDRPLNEERISEYVRQNWVQHLGKRPKEYGVWYPPLASANRESLWEASFEVDGLGIRQFHEGVAGFYRVDDPGCPGHWGIVRSGGAIVTEPRYSFVGKASEGLIPVCVPVEGAPKSEYCSQCHCPVPLNLCGYVDLNGKLRIPLEHLVDFQTSGDHGSFVGSFHHGLAALQDGKTRLMGYINRTGKWVIPPQFASAGEFAANGLAPASVPSATEVHELPPPMTCST